MAFTKIVGAGIHTLSNVHTHNINSSGIITATNFVGVFSGTDGDFSGNVSIGGSLTVNGDFTTLNTTLREVEILNVDANSSESAGIITQRGSGDILNLFDTNTEVFTVIDGGDVGIGTATIDSSYGTNLNIHSSGNNTGARIKLTDGTSGTGNVDGFDIFGINGRAYIFNRENYEMVLGTDNKIRLRIDDDGAISVGHNPGQSTGTNTQNAILTLKGYPNENESSAAILALIRGYNTTSATANHTLGRIVFGDKQAGEYAFIEGEVEANGAVGDTPGRLVFSTAPDNTSAPTEKLRIDKDGILWVNYGNPQSSSLMILDKDGTGDAELRFYNAGSNKAKIALDSSEELTFDVNGAERLRITSTGNIIAAHNGGGVGIRTDNPTTTFHVRGAGVFTSQTGGTITNGLFLDPGDTGAGNRPDIMLKGAGSAALNNLAMQVYYNNGSNKAFHLRYDGGTYHEGRIAIGVENPNNFESTADDFVISRSYDAGITISTGSAGSTNTGSILFAEGTGGTQDKNRGAIKYKHGDDYLAFHTNYNEQLRLDANGRLKVGDNTRPASDANEGAQLRVVGAPLTRNQYYSPAGDYYGSFGYTNNSNTKAWLAVDSSYAQSNAVSAGIFLSAFHQDAGGSACGYTIKNLKSTNSLVFSSVKTAASVGNPAVEEERVRINHTGEVGINVTASSGNLLHIKTTTADSFAKIESESGYDAALLLDTSNGSGASADVRFQMDGSTKGSIQYVNNASSADANSMIFRTGNNSAKMQITTGGNIGIPDRTGTDFSLLDGMVINTANGSAGLLINSSSSSHNAYLGFSYGSGSSTSHDDQYSAYIGRVGDDTLILGAGNGIKVQIGTDGEIKCVGANDNKGFAVYTSATKKVAELIEHSADGELRLYTGESTPVLRSVITSYGDSYLCANSTNKLGIGVGGAHGTIAQKVHIYDASNDPYIRIQRGGTSDVNLGGIEFASSNGNGNNMIGTIYGRATGNSATTGVMIFKARDSSSGSSTLHEPLRALGKSSSGCRLMSQGNAVCVFGRHHEAGGTDATGDAPTYNVVYEHSSSSYRTSGNGAFGGTFVVGGNASTWYPVWFSLPTHQDPQILSVNKYVHNYATWDGKLLFRASLNGTGYGAFAVQHRIHFFSYSYKQFVGKAVYTGHNNAFLVLWMLGGGRSYQWGTIGATPITVNVGDDGNNHNLGPGNTSEGPITSAVTIPVGYEKDMSTSGTHQQTGFN